MSLLYTQVSVKYAGQEVPQCPIRVPVQPHVDVSKVKVDGLEPSKFCFMNFLPLRCQIVQTFRAVL
jgi:hypothetical protein